MRVSSLLVSVAAMIVAMPSMVNAQLSDVTLTYCSARVTDKQGIDRCDPKKTIKSTEIAPRGTETNIIIMATFKPVAAPWRLLFQITDQNDAYVEDIQIPIPAKGAQATMHTTIVKPGVYNIKVRDGKQTYVTEQFTVTEDKVGARASGNQKANQAALTVCESVDGNWKAVGAATTWPAGKSFNVLLVADKPFRVSFIGFVIHKQDDKGTDVAFIDEWQQTIGEPEKFRMYATEGGMTSLKPGKYSIYAIDWAKREVGEHRGNLTDAFAKVTLTVE
jgi:hypothetical protein